MLLVTGSIIANRPRPGLAAYVASKAGVIGLARALAIELAPDIRVNVINPGPANTPMLGGFGFDGDPARGAPAQAPDRARGHRRRRRLPGLRRRQGDHRRGLQRRRGPRPVSLPRDRPVDAGTSSPSCRRRRPSRSPSWSRTRAARSRSSTSGARRRCARRRSRGSPAPSRHETDKLAELETRDTGKPLSQAKADVAATVRYLDYYAGSIERLEGRQIPLGPDVLDYTVREPWGVCAQIIPWNYPLQVTARCAAPALAAGNAVIVKPSELASITPLRFAELAEEAGVPRGMIQIATGDGATGAALAEHEGVDHVTFVGSAATGARVAEACARRLAPIELELGGKSPNVVFADADLDKAVPAIVQRADPERRPELLGGLAAAGRAADLRRDDRARRRKRSKTSRSAPASRTRTSAR